METRKENTAAGNATLLPEDPYSPEQQIMYHTSLALIDKLVQDGLLTQADFKRACVILTKKYGPPDGSIFAEVA